MAEPSASRNFFGGLVDRVLPGQNYSRETGSFSNIGAGLGGLAARVAVSALAGPAAGALAGKAASWIIDRNGKVGPVNQERIPLTGNVSYGNLGLGQPSIGNGNVSVGPVTQFQAQMPGQSFGYTPQSSWGAAISSPTPAVGSIGNFGDHTLVGRGEYSGFSPGGGFGGSGGFGSFGGMGGFGGLGGLVGGASPGSVRGFGNNLDAFQKM